MPVLQKHSKFERTRVCNCSFIIKKIAYHRMLLLLELRISFEKRDDGIYLLFVIINLFILGKIRCLKNL